MLFIIFRSIRVRMCWKIGENRNLFRKLKTKMGLSHVILTTPETFPEKPTLTAIEMPNLRDIEKTDSTGESFCLKRTRFKSRRKVSVNFKNDVDKLNIFVYWYRINLYLKGNQVHLRLTEYQLLLAKRVNLLSYTDKFYLWCIVLAETSIHK